MPAENSLTQPPWAAFTSDRCHWWWGACGGSLLPHTFSHSVHGVEDLLPLDADGNLHLLAQSLQQSPQLAHGGAGLADIHGHDHGEGPLQNGLGDVQNVDVVLGESTEDTSESNDNDQNNNNNNNNNNNDDYNDYYGNYGNGLGGYNYGYGF